MEVTRDILGGGGGDMLAQDVFELKDRAAFQTCSKARVISLFASLCWRRCALVFVLDMGTALPTCAAGLSVKY